MLFYLGEYVVYMGGFREYQVLASINIPATQTKEPGLLVSAVLIVHVVAVGLTGDDT